MNLRLGGKAAAITAAVALGGAGVAVAAQSPASASTFSETYSCNGPDRGHRDRHLHRCDEGGAGGQRGGGFPGRLITDRKAASPGRDGFNPP